MAYHSDNYQLQRALKQVLEAALDTYNAGAAGALPFALGGEFDDRGQDHVFVLVDAVSEVENTAGTMQANVTVGVVTKKQTSIETHESYCKSVFDLVTDPALATSVTATGIISVQHPDAFRFEAGYQSENTRFTQCSFTMLVYHAP